MAAGWRPSWQRGRCAAPRSGVAAGKTFDARPAFEAGAAVLPGFERAGRLCFLSVRADCSAASAAAFGPAAVEFGQRPAEIRPVNGLLRRINGVVCEYPVETALRNEQPATTAPGASSLSCSD